MLHSTIQTGKLGNTPYILNISPGPGMATNYTKIRQVEGLIFKLRLLFQY